MYLEFYGLEQAPFSITPDPHFVFLSEHHRDALAHLLYGIQQGGSGGFVQLTGEVGTGKTTLSRLLLNQLPENTQAALVLNPRLEPVELLQTICEELRLPLGTQTTTTDDTAVAETSEQATDAQESPAAPAPVHAPAPSSANLLGGKALFDALSVYLLEAYARGERVVVIIDEAQNLSADALEQVRLLTNLETETQKLLQIILIGQPELRDTLARPELRQLAQRITARYHLRPLDERATSSYLRHRLNTSGAKRFPFSADAVRRIHRHSGGVPRLINVIAERALLGGYAQDLLTIDAKTVDRAAAEALAPSAESRDRHDRTPLITVGALVVLAAVIAFALSRGQTSETAAAAVAASTVTTPAVTAPAGTATASSNAHIALGGEALLKRILDTPADSSREWLALNTRWKTPASVRKNSADACPPTLAPGWRCQRSRASLDQLLRLDRPVLLRLRVEPSAVWASLLGGDTTKVRVSLNGSAIDIDRIALNTVWNGEYLAIWPAPDSLEARYASGDTSAREWVSKRIRADGINHTDPAAALRAFRASHGLRDSAALDADTVFVLANRGSGPRLPGTIPSEKGE